MNAKAVDLHRHVYGSLPKKVDFLQGRGFQSFIQQYERHCEFSVFKRESSRAERVNEIESIIDIITKQAFIEGLRKCDFRLNLYYQNLYPHYLIETITVALAEASETYSIDFSLALSIPRDEKISIPIITNFPSDVSSKYISGIDFCGDESPAFNLSGIVDTFKSRYPEKGIFIHAGEQYKEYGDQLLMDSIHCCLSYGVDRIGHGTVLISNILEGTSLPAVKERLIEKIIEHKVIIEFCPFSLKNIYGYSDKQIQRAYTAMIRRNLNLVICTDNPGLFDCTVKDAHLLCTGQLQ